MLSIIIPVYNQHEMTKECIAAVNAYTHGKFEIIVIDNGSDPKIGPIDAVSYGTTVIRNVENKGFPAAVNQGLDEAKGNFICLLNNDVIVTPGWSERLLDCLKNFSIVGPVTKDCAGIQRVSLPTYRDENELNIQAEIWQKENEGQIKEVNWVIGFCMMFRANLFKEVGPFDESLWPCCGEEIDWCLRAKTYGHLIGIVEDVYVHHAHSTTFKAMEKDGELDYVDVCKRNERHLIRKWGEDVFNQIVGTLVRADSTRLNLGCGYNHEDGYINIDNRETVGPDLVCDVLGGLPYPDCSVDEVRAFDFLEHIPIGKTIQVVTEIWRVLKPGGLFESFTPSTDGRGAFQDPTHVSFWNKNSWLYYSDHTHRHLYDIEANFEIAFIQDTIPDAKSRIIHTHVKATAIK